MRFDMQARIYRLRQEIVEIAALRNLRHISGSEKIKHEMRIKRLQEIAGELHSMARNCGAETNNPGSCPRQSLS